MSIQPYNTQPIRIKNIQDFYDMMRCDNCRTLHNRLCDKCQKMENIRENREKYRANDSGVWGGL